MKPSIPQGTRAGFENILQGKNEKRITERALRYDLTIPFARYIAMNYGQITLPFKRYQVQPVWRADRPQKGRYREFYQCDADVAGTYSLISDVEFCHIYATVFERLKIEVDIKINNRKILYGLAEICQRSDKLNVITGAIDKLEKIGLEKVKEELTRSGLTPDEINIIEEYIHIEGTNELKLEKVEQLLAGSETGKKGIEELRFILGFSSAQKVPQNIILDFTLARGLDYYTGSIYEVKARKAQMGSIGGGGRYDDLAGLFGAPKVPGVGISFGLDRIYDVMEELALFPQSIAQPVKALFFNLGETEIKFAFDLMQKCRGENISCELYYEKAKLDKQFKYAEKKHIPYVVIIGSKEIETAECVIKNLSNGEQKSIPVDQLCSFIRT